MTTCRGLRVPAVPGFGFRVLKWGVQGGYTTHGSLIL